MGNPGMCHQQGYLCKAKAHNSTALRATLFRRKKLPWVGFEPTNLRSLGTSALPTHTMIRWLSCSCTGLNIIDSNELFTVLVWQRGGGDPSSEKHITYTLFTVLDREGGNGGDPFSCNSVRVFSHQLVSPWPYSYVWLAPHVLVHRQGTLGQMA